MIRTTITRTLAVALMLLALAGVARADSAPYAVQRALTNGGGAMTAGSYTLTSSIGQPLAGPVGQANGDALVSGLFAAPGSANGAVVYLPVARR